MEEEQKENQADEEEEMSTEEVVEQNDYVLGALIDLLIEKKVFTEEEFNKKLEEPEEDE